jgi:prepilin-type processing-associated H-X9-DG protein
MDRVVRIIGWTFGLSLLFFGLLCIGFPGLDLVFYTAFGWATFLTRTAAKVHVRWDLAGSAVAYAAALAVGAHFFLRWVYREMIGGAWKMRWTLGGFGVVILMFVAGTAAIGIVHQTTWLVRSPERMFRPTGALGDRVRCGSNLRQIGQGLMIYALDHGGAYPDDLRSLLLDKDVDLNVEVLVCPASNDEKASGRTVEEIAENLEKPGHCSYIYLGRGVPETAEAETRVVAVEPLRNHDGEGMNVLYGDGHVEWLVKEEAEALMKKLGLEKVERGGATTRPAASTSR